MSIDFWGPVTGLGTAEVEGRKGFVPPAAEDALADRGSNTRTIRSRPADVLAGV